MLKNFGKFKQWTGERLGAAKVTLQTEDFQQLETETEIKRSGFEKVHEASEQVYGQLCKKKPSPEDAKVKCPPLEILSNCWINHGADHNDNSALGVALINLGQTETRISLLQEDFASTIKSEYIGVLEQGLQNYKEYDALKKKLESRRLDYDAKLSRLHKSKKEKPEWQQEMQVAKIKYEECEHLIIQKMATLQDYEIDHCNALYHLMEAQLAYHQQSVDMINELRGHMPIPQVNRSTRPPIPPITRSSTNGSSYSSSISTNGYDKTSDGSFGGQISLSSTGAKYGQHLSGSRQPSIDSLDRFRRTPSYSSGSNYSGIDQGQHPRSSNRSPPPIAPRRKSSPNSRKLRKALYDFEAQSPDELSFDTGDMISVIESVDEGWWMGEMDQDGTKRRGIFPVDYTEDVIMAANTTPSPPSIPNRTRMMNSDDTYSNQHEKDERIYGRQYQQEQNDAHNDQSPYQDNRPSNTPASSNALSSIKSSPSSQTRLPPTPSSTPLPKPSTFTHSTNRPPPPPPPILQRSSTLSITTPSPSIRTPPPPPSRIKPATLSAIGTNQMADCQDCGCDDFSVNLFKKDQCNNCFHRHVVC